MSNLEAYIYISPSNAFGMPDSTAGDLLFYTNTSNQNIAFGSCNDTSRFEVSRTTSYFKNRLGINNSNPQFTVDVIGDFNVTGGDLNINGAPFPGNFSTGNKFTVDTSNRISTTTGMTIMYSNTDTAIPQWSAIINSCNNQVIISQIVTDYANNVIIAGYTNNTIALQIKHASGQVAVTLSNPVQGSANDWAFVAKYTSNGSNLFANIVGRSSNNLLAGNTYISDLAVDSSNDIYICGSYSSCNLHIYSSNVLTATGTVYGLFGASSNATKGFVGKIGSNGVPLWLGYYYNTDQATHQKSVSCTGLAVQKDTNDMYVLVSDETYNTSSSNSTSYLRYSINSSGNAYVANTSHKRAYTAVIKLFKNNGAFNFNTTTQHPTIGDPNLNTGREAWPSKIAIDNVTGDVYITGYDGSGGGTNTVFGINGNAAFTFPAAANNWIVKFNSNHTPMWVAFSSNQLSSTVMAMSVDTKGNLITAGYSRYSYVTYNAHLQQTVIEKTLTKNAGTSQMKGIDFGVISKWSSNGSNIWNAKIDGNSHVYIYGMCIDSNNNNIYVTGITYDKVFGYSYDNTITGFQNMGRYSTTFSGCNTGFVSKFDETGRNYWISSITSSTNFHCVANKISLSSNGSNFYVAGYQSGQNAYAYDNNNSNLVSTPNHPSGVGNNHGFLFRYDVNNHPYRLISNLGSNDNGIQKIVVNTTAQNIPVIITDSNNANIISHAVVSSNSTAQFYWFKDEWMYM